MESPHLPPKSCSVPAYYVRQSLPWIFLVAILSVVAGIAASLVSIAWVVPSIIPQSGSAIVGGSRTSAATTPDTLLTKSVAQRTVTIFDKTKKRAGIAYTADAVVGTAAVLSSDGWLVLSLSEFKEGQERTWEIIDFQGISYEPLAVLVDPIVGLVYVQVNAEGLPIMSFAPESAYVRGSMLWTHSYQHWSQTTIDSSVRVLAMPWFVWQHAQRPALQGNPQAGEMLFAQTGELAGFVDEHKTFIDVSFVQRQLRTLLQEGELAHMPLPLEGYLVDGVFVEESYVRRPGFLVTKSGEKNVRVGDIIFSVGNNDVVQSELVKHIMDAPKEISFIILREEEELEVTISSK